MGESLDEGQAERPSLVLGKAANRGVESLAAKPPPDLVVDVVRRLEQCQIRFGRLAFRGRLAAHGVDRLVAGQREHPRSERATGGVEPAGVVPDGHEGVLDCFLGETLGPRHAHRHGVHAGRETLVESLDGVLVTGGDPRHQFRVLHRRLTTGGSGGRRTQSSISSSLGSIVKGDPASPVADMIRRGIGEVLQPALDSGAIKIVGEPTTVNWGPSTAVGEMDAILQKNENKIDAVIAEDDWLAAGVIKSLSDAGLGGKIPVSGAGLMAGFPSLSNYKAVVNGVQTVDVWSDYRELGKAAGEAALQLCHDRDIAKVSGTVPFTTPGGTQLTRRAEPPGW